MKPLRQLFLYGYFSLATLPLLWMVATSFKSKADSISIQPKLLPALTDAGVSSIYFESTVESYIKLGEAYAGAKRTFFDYLINSVAIGLCSTLFSVIIGTSCAYGFSRFAIRGSRDWLFFILSTRFLPPLAVVVPVLMMYRELDLQNTHVGLILLYTSFNLSLSVWLMKGFLDDVPRAFEEAAMIDGYSRWQSFRLVVLPRAVPGMAVTAVFCLISAWNEYGFAMTLNSRDAVTVPVYFAGLQGNVQGLPWPQVCAGALLFVAPIVVFTILVRRHLLRGVTFGTIKR